MKKKELNKLAKKYNVFHWMYVPSPIFCTTDGKDWMVQDYDTVESLFKNGEGKLVCIYKIDYKSFSGKMATRGTVVDKKHLEKTMNRDTSWDDPQLSDGDMSNRHKNALKNTFPEVVEKWDKTLNITDKPNMAVLMESEASKLLKEQNNQLDELNDYLRMLADMDKIGIRRKIVLLEGYINKIKNNII